jgi:D-alanyl-D-alanine carboxypeptidase (penicillin-binding protein 5/6)
MSNTQFRNASGLSEPGHYASARDLAVLAQRLILDFPDYLPLYSQREYIYNNIKQPNRNRLLWLDPAVDGLKTGHTEAAGYCLIATARRELPAPVKGQRRLVSVVLGTSSDNARAQECEPRAPIYGSDVAFRMVDFAERNAERAGVAHAVQLRGGDASTQPAEERRVEGVVAAAPRGMAEARDLVDRIYGRRPLPVDCSFSCWRNDGAGPRQSGLAPATAAGRWCRRRRGSRPWWIRGAGR